MLDTYLPGHTMVTRDLDDQPELTEVPMPSTVTATARAMLDGVLLNCEAQLRLAAVQESLTNLLNQLRSRQLFKTYRISNARGTRATIAVSESLRRCSNNAMVAADAYRRHRAALATLDPRESWAAQFKELRDSDIRGINERALTEDEARTRDTMARLQHQVADVGQDKESEDEDDELGALPTRATAPGETGDRLRAISWIWHNTPALNEQALTTADPALVQSLRAEWAKSKIRAHHWRIQLILVCEEMRRSLAFVRVKAQEWKDLADTTSRDDDVRRKEGKRAYALKRVAAYDGLHAKWAALWCPLVSIAKRTSFKDDIVDLGVTVGTSDGPVVIDVSTDAEDDGNNGDMVRDVIFASR
jgi:hypothetical protein